MERGITRVTYKPKEKLPVIDFLSAMGRTRHLAKEEYRDIVMKIQDSVDRKWEELLK